MRPSVLSDLGVILLAFVPSRVPESYVVPLFQSFSITCVGVGRGISHRLTKVSSQAMCSPTSVFGWNFICLNFTLLA